MPIGIPGASELRSDADKKLTQFARENFATSLSRVQTYSAVGSVIEEIIKHAQQHTIDMVVMGTHADGLLKRVVFGSVGRGVLESAPCSVLPVPVRDAPR